MKAIVESVGGVASRVRVGSHTLQFDQPQSVPGGQDLGPSPLDAMAVSVAACAHYFAAAFLFGRKLSTEALRVELKVEKTREPAPRLGKVKLHIILPPEVPEHYLAAIERAVRNCPAYGTLLYPPELQLTVAKAEASAATPAA